VGDLEHEVSRMDTLAGITVNFRVEVISSNPAGLVAAYGVLYAFCSCQMRGIS
jgi:hypothetical protein